jgi:hypothetical protein
MNKLFTTMIASAVAFGALSAPAYADHVTLSVGGHGAHHRHFAEREYFRPYGYHHYRSPQIVYYEPAPVVVNRYYPAPVVVQQQPLNEADNRYCREYYGPANVGGRIQQTYGTACLQPDGSWQIVN